MIKNETNLVVADNSGARVVRVIRLLGGSTRTTSYIGDLIKCSVKEASPHATVKKGEIYKAVIIRSKFGARRADGSYIKFDDNAVVLVKDDGNPIGSRIFGPVARELREQSKYSKILSLAEEVL